jgi:hypothetical protein
MYDPKGRSQRARKARKPLNILTMTMRELDALYRKCAPQEAKRLGISVAEPDRRVAELYHQGKLAYAHRKTILSHLRERA